MKAWTEITHYAGFDWGRHRHKVVIVDRQGQIVADLAIEHSASGWQRWREQVAALGGAVAACVETSQGMIIEQLLESGVSLYPIAPRRAKAYRERKAPSGTKSDHLDAWSLADALRLDGHGWRALGKEDPVVAELRLLCRDEVALIEERTALVNQLQSALQEYYPAALEAFEDWTLPAAWAFLEAFPTPGVLRAAGQRKWEKFLPSHKLARPQTLAKRLEIFARAGELVSGEVLTRTKSRLALTRTRMLRVLEQQLEVYRLEIERLFAQHPDHHLFGSLPGAGPKIAPRLLGEIGSDRGALISTPCSVWPAPRPLAIKAARSTSSLCAATVIRRSGPPSISGLISVGNPLPGQQSIIKPCAPAANPMLVPCAAWASAGSRSSGKCGSPASATTLTSMPAINSNTAPGSSNCRTLNPLPAMSITPTKKLFETQRTSTIGSAAKTCPPALARSVCGAWHGRYYNASSSFPRRTAQLTVANILAAQE